MQIGLPAALEQILTSSAFFVLIIVVAGLGTNTLAAHQISFTALSASFLPGFGFAIAATTLVGQSVGARRIAEGNAAAKIATGWAVIWMGVFGALILIFAEPIMRLFTNNQAVIDAGTNGLRVVALSQPFWAVQLVLSGALRGTGDTRFPLVVGSLGMWIGVGLAALFVTRFQGGLALVWVAFLIVAPIIGALYWWRFQRTVATMALAEQANP
jgi:putative MATE family efflux protein